MLPCPNCIAPMSARAVEVFMTAKPVQIDACTACRLFWFDQYESTSLKPRSTLDLFQFIGSAAAAPVTPLSSHFSCPRCQIALEQTLDLQRTTTFTYWRCGFNHGRLISFNQFLREKNFIRTPGPAELARLRETIRQVSCSQCGAPIDLANASACSHCGAPIALIDPDGVAKAIGQLNAGSPGAAGEAGAADPAATLRDAQIDALLNIERARLHHEQSAPAPHIDMLSVGAQAIGALIGAFLTFR